MPVKKMFKVLFSWKAVAEIAVVASSADEAEDMVCKVFPDVTIEEIETETDFSEN